MKKIKLLPLFLLGIIVAFQSCKKTSDTDLQLTVESVLKTYEEAKNVTVAVEKKTVILTGIVADADEMELIESVVKAIKDVAGVVNNLSLHGDEALEVVQTTYDPEDEMVTQLAEILKDFPTVKGSVSLGIVTLEGEISKKELPALMQKITELRPEMIENELVIK